jgi:RNA polymerase sigma factor (sigma-70 family)
MNLLKQIDTLFRAGTAAGLTDGELLERFGRGREESAEAAFAVLVERHGAMVLRVCHQVLRNEHDAEEAAQATFLVLARRAASIRRRDSVACWLHGVALRVASKARVMAARRRTHERRGGQAMVARQANHTQGDAILDHERWDLLHEEVGRLPDTFRSAVVLCDLEGRTQEQAAAQLRCPLGTVQSRLARGRAKLKARLERRGLELSAFAQGVHGANQVGPPQEAWTEATVKLAVCFAHKSSLGVAAAAPAALAEEVLKAMIMTKLTKTVAMILVGATMISATAALARHERQSAALVATKPANGQSPDDPHQKEVPAEPEWVTKTIRGIVRDEQGRPVAKAWVGSAVTWQDGQWKVVMPFDAIRETKEPFRDDRGQIVPPSGLGKYFELKDDTGTWQPIHPTRVRRFEKPLDDGALGHSAPRRFIAEVPPAALEAIEKGQVVIEIAEPGRWEMLSDSERLHPADRTDSQGNFRLESRISTQFAHELHFASPDFLRQAIHVVHFDEPDAPLEITARPLRTVRARLIETPRDVSEDTIEWTAYSVDPRDGKLEFVPAIDAKGVSWSSGTLQSVIAAGLPREDRTFEVHLPAGEYKVHFWFETVNQVIDLAVPPGDRPLELPEIRLETLAWVKMLGKAAAEIDAVDGDGHPVKLAEQRGKVVVLTFWSGKRDTQLDTIRRLTQIKTRLKGQPLAILAVHDATLTSLEEFKKAVSPLGDRSRTENPVRLLLDRPPAVKAQGSRSRPRAGEHGSGRTADSYEIWNDLATLVIGKNGSLDAVIIESVIGTSTFAVDQAGVIVREFVRNDSGHDPIERQTPSESLVGAIESALGLPRSRPPDRPAVAAQLVRPAAAIGKVTDTEGRPIAGATVTSAMDLRAEHGVKTGPAGEFEYKFREREDVWPIRIEAAGFAARRFLLLLKSEGEPDDGINDSALIEPSGVIARPLVLGSGVEVVGRVVRDGKPVAGVSMGLGFVYGNDQANLVGNPEMTTDERGSFRFLNVAPETGFWIYAKLGSVNDEGALIPQRIQTKHDGTTVDLGELQIRHGRNLAGRLICSDGKPVPAGTTVWLWCDHSAGVLDRKVDDAGSFQMRGIADGLVTLEVTFPEAKAAETRYRVSPENACRNPQVENQLEGRVERDISDLTILLDPDFSPKRELHLIRDVDPAMLADFNDAKAGPINGVPPRR